MWFVDISYVESMTSVQEDTSTHSVDIRCKAYKSHSRFIGPHIICVWWCITYVQGSVQCLQFDDNKLVSGSWDTTCIVCWNTSGCYVVWTAVVFQVWDVVKGSEIHKLIGHTECVSSLKFDEIRLLVLFFNLLHIYINYIGMCVV